MTLAIQILTVPAFVLGYAWGVVAFRFQRGACYGRRDARGCGGMLV